MISEAVKQRQIDASWAQHHRRRADLLRGIQLTSSLRDRLAEQQNWRCCYCGDRMEGQGCDPNAPSFEHVVPLSVGGPNSIENLVIACRRCNQLRSSDITELHIAAVEAWESAA